MLKNRAQKSVDFLAGVDSQAGPILITYIYHKTLIVETDLVNFSEKINLDPHVGMYVFSQVYPH